MENRHPISSVPLPGEEVMTAEGKWVGESVGSEEGCGGCAICLDKIALHEMAVVKGCEHAYCVTCILRWATYNEIHTCPQCKHPFEFLNVHRSLDGSIRDYMFEESVRLLLRAYWFVSSTINSTQDVEPQQENYDELEELFQTEVDQELDAIEQEESDYASKASIRIGNRRWGDNGYIRTERKKARLIARQYYDDATEAGPSHGSKKEVPKHITGRRAKRAMKREAANKSFVESHVSPPP